MPSSFWQYHRNIEINVTNNRHFALVYLLGKLDYSLYGQRNNNRLYILLKCHYFLSSCAKEAVEIAGMTNNTIYHLLFAFKIAQIMDIVISRLQNFFVYISFNVSPRKTDFFTSFCPGPF